MGASDNSDVEEINLADEKSGYESEGENVSESERCVLLKD